LCFEVKKKKSGNLRNQKIIEEEERINEFAGSSLVPFALFFLVLVSSLRIAHAFLPSLISGSHTWRGTSLHNNMFFLFCSMNFVTNLVQFIIFGVN